MKYNYSRIIQHIAKYKCFINFHLFMTLESRIEAKKLFLIQMNRSMAPLYREQFILNLAWIFNNRDISGSFPILMATESALVKYLHPREMERKISLLYGNYSSVKWK